jgi:hypothetical protein
MAKSRQALLLRWAELGDWAELLLAEKDIRHFQKSRAVFSEVYIMRQEESMDEQQN